MSRVPVLVVHGLWDSPLRLEPLTDGLRQRELALVAAMKLSPADGSAPLRELAKQVVRSMNGLATDGSADAIDVVGFSMGALVTRASLLLERDKIVPKVRTFISISGPHAGARNAHVMPSSRFPGIADMRPRSDFLRALEAAGPIQGTEVHCLYTPYDLMVTPAKSAILPGARSVQMFPVAMHRFMITDRRVLDHVAAILHGHPA